MINASIRPMIDAAEQQWATVSFVPEDLPWFDWIIRQIEGYPVPAELSGAPTRYGFTLPLKLTLFPDRWNPLNFEGYPAALASSRFLIVIVSPNVAQSSWVDDQMQAFRKADGEERIVALVVDGRPEGGGSSGSSGWLPKWLAFRNQEDGFAPADSTEPVVIDTRGGSEKLEKAREALLASLLTTTCHELERMGGLAPPLDLSQPVAPIPTGAPKPAAPVASVSEVPRITRKQIAVAAVAALLLFGSGWYVGHAMAPAPATSPGTVSHAPSQAGATPATASPTVTATDPTAPPKTEETANRKRTRRGPVPTGGAATAVALPEPIPQATVAAPTPAAEPAPVPAPAPAPVPVVEGSPNFGSSAVPDAEVPISGLPSPIPEASAQSAPVLEVSTPASSLPILEQPAAALQTERERAQREQARRDEESLRAAWVSQVAAGDAALRKGNKVQATDFYAAAIGTAEKYAMRRSDDVDSLTAMAILCRRLGAMQLQTASVAEARASYERGRRVLLGLKAQGELNAAHAQILQELEMGLQTLPRD